MFVNLCPGCQGGQGSESTSRANLASRRRPVQGEERLDQGDHGQGDPVPSGAWPGHWSCHPRGGQHPSYPARRGRGTGARRQGPGRSPQAGTAETGTDQFLRAPKNEAMWLSLSQSKMDVIGFEEPDGILRYPPVLGEARHQGWLLPGAPCLAMSVP